MTTAALNQRKRQLGKAKARQYRVHYLLLLPAFILSFSVILIPGIFTVITSFTNWDGISPAPEFVGVANFAEIFKDPIFFTAVGNNIKWTLLFLTIPVILGLGVAMLLITRPRSRTIFQIFFLLPYVMAAAVNAIVWLNMIYSPVSGVVGVLQHLGLNIENPLSNPRTALFAVAAVDLWHYWGFLLVIYLAALRQTPFDQVEAARVEGANSWQVFRHVYFPSISSTIKMTMVMIIIFSFLTFDYIFLMTQGGPAHSTEMLSTYAYTFAFATFQFGKAAAVGLVMSFFGLVASFFYARMNRRS